ncbi:helix-turn-helix domain-containing protein [Williamsia sp.]|uniref:helix-turn-helix domain-containing protein n=1 Tax=Williamsia sp. TaxID=1872085 RepID=UPI002F953146
MLQSVAVILQEPVAAFEYGVVCEVFGVDRTDEGVPRIDLRVCGIEPGTPLNFTTGAQIVPQYGLEACADADLVAIPAGRVSADYPEVVLDVLRAADKRGAYILSVCTGAFVVAAAGLLSGRSATTHWRYGAAMSELFPDVEVNTDVLYVQEGNIITSAGTAAGIDASLHLVRTELGPTVANKIARRMVVPPHREGGQRQFVKEPVPDCDNDGFGQVLGWMLSNLDADIAISDMAAKANMSPRTFARRFRDEVGTSPLRWLTEQRVLAAQGLLESSSHGIEEIARRVGFGSSTLLRHHFSTAVGITPTAFRSRFGCVG